MPLSVLLVGDSAPFCADVCGLIDRIEGLELERRARTVPEALSAMRAKGPDLVLLDLGLPRLSAMEVLGAAGSLRPRPVTVVLTERTDPLTRRLCLAAGADHFFTKLRPLPELEELLRRLSAGGSGNLRLKAWARRAGDLLPGLRGASRPATAGR